MPTTDAFIFVPRQSSERRVESPATCWLDDLIGMDSVVSGFAFPTLSAASPHPGWLLLLGTYSSAVRSPVGSSSIIFDAERRLTQIQADTAQPKIFDDDDAQAPTSGSAVQRAQWLIRIFASWVVRPTRHIAIFPMPNGGLQLQSTGADSAVSIEIPPDADKPILAELASDQEYHSLIIPDVRAAAQFLALAVR